VTQLKRVASRWQIVALALNDVVGSGVYLLPAAAAALLGPVSLAAVVVAGLAVLLIVLCFAEASSHFDEPGSAYLYARQAFGPLVGFEVGFMAWLARVASLASLSVGFALALSYLLPGTTGGTGRVLAIAVPMLALTAINIIGVRSGVNTAVALVIGKLIPLAVFVAAGVFAMSWSRIVGQQATGAGGLGEGALLLLFAYAGFENTPAAAGEFKNPKRDVPFALLVEVGLVTLIYSSVQLVALGTVPELARSQTPLADGARIFLGSWGGWLLTAGAVVSILGTNGNSILAGPRYLFALARDGYGPRFLASVHPRFRTPAAAILLQTAIALPLALSGTFVGLATLSVVARLATYLATMAAVPVLRRRFATEHSFRLPGGAAIPAAATVVSLSLLASASWSDLVAGALALGAGGIVFAFRKAPRTRDERSDL
jgi:APA family basic amino acid/polyamine antiporter